MKQTSFVYCLNVAICLAWRLPYSYICVPWFNDGTIMSPIIIKTNANKNRFNYLWSHLMNTFVLYRHQLYCIESGRNTGVFHQNLFHFLNQNNVLYNFRCSVCIISMKLKITRCEPFYYFLIKANFLLLVIFLIAHYHWTLTTEFFVRINGGGRGKDIIYIMKL